MENGSSNMRLVVTGSVSTHASKKHAKLFGKDFSVFPSTMMVVGSHYPKVERQTKPTSIHFSEDELQHSVNTWNGRPVSINHPEHEVTCNSPDTYNRQWVGYVFNARYDKPNKSLKSELWIDNERGKIINDLVSSGKQLEVSIGVFGKLNRARSNDPFDFDMANIVGDHLAILPNSKGACSWEDGCGIRAETYTHSAVAQAVEPIKDEGNEPCHSYEDQRKEERTQKAALSGLNDERTQQKSQQQESEGMQQVQHQQQRNERTQQAQAAQLENIHSHQHRNANWQNQHHEPEVQMDQVQQQLKEEQRTQQEQPQPCQPEAQMVSNEEKNRQSGSSFNKEEWWSQAPSNFRSYLMHSMQNYDRQKEGYINKIVSCKSAVFCEKALNSLEDMSILEGISDLVDALAEAPKTVAAVAGNYQFRAGSASSGKTEAAPTYATFKDINYKEMEDERLEKERVRRVTHG